jgi:VIT1/CCC1 family predicted Fe2+/Mn2+ transporter
MGRSIAYWLSTGIVAALMIFDGVLYLSGSAQVAEGFAHLGYPPHLRVILGIAKLCGALVLIAPGFRLLKEWAYAGFTFVWIGACIAHASAGDGAKSFTPMVLLAVLGVSYAMRPNSRRLVPVAAPA